MKKLKLYLDTSVVSHLDQKDAPEKMIDTHMLWADIKRGDYQVYISDRVFAELEDCSDEKQKCLSDYLNEIVYNVLKADVAAAQLAQEYITNKILTQNSYDDCMHMALATIHDCDIIVSWNFKHMVRYKTIVGVRAVNALNGYIKPIEIMQPTLLLNKEV